jgi:hypothetical protein
VDGENSIIKLILSAGNGDGDFTLIQNGVNSTLDLELPSLGYSIGNFVINVAEPTATLRKLTMPFMDRAFKGFSLTLPSQGLDKYGRCAHAPSVISLAALREVGSTLTLTGCFNAVQLDSLTTVGKDVLIQGPAGQISLGLQRSPRYVLERAVERWVVWACGCMGVWVCSFACHLH